VGAKGHELSKVRAFLGDCAMSEVSLSDTSIAIVALHQEREALRANRSNVVRVLNDYDELISALDDRIKVLVAHQHNCMCWRVT
jgi:hypothetical protein